ncbi:MAG: hypothetical protein ACP5DZ_11560 [Bacteroidales bacterium]
MANKIIAGDYEGGKIKLSLGDVSIHHSGRLIPLTLNKRNVSSVEIITEENKKKFIGTAGWSIAGAAVLGLAGFVAGAKAGGNKKEVTFACYLKNGKKFIAVTDVKVYKKILSLSF